MLSSFAWEARYPRLDEPVTVEEYQEAVRPAEAVVAWAEALPGRRCNRMRKDYRALVDGVGILVNQEFGWKS